MKGDDFILRLIIVLAILFAVEQVITGQAEPCDGYYASYDHASMECVPYDPE